MLHVQLAFGGCITDDIPKLYETDGVPFEKKTIYEKWSIDRIGFYWLIAEMDRKENIAFGYANLNDEQMAEWGYISVEELIDCGASKDRSWKPVPFLDAQKAIKKYKRDFHHR